MKTVLIAGGGFAGVAVAHRIFQETSGSSQDLRMVLVSRDAHFYWNIASPRALIPGRLEPQQIFLPIECGFNQYSNRFELTIGSVTSVDSLQKSVYVDSDGSKHSLSYDILIIATGTTTVHETPFKSRGTTESTREVLTEFRQRVDKAQTIVVVGGGATAIEVAGELGYRYNTEKSIILVSRDSTFLSHKGCPAHIAKTIETGLEDLNVLVKSNVLVVDEISTKDGRKSLKLNNGETILADLCIQSIGLQPNTSFMPKKFLDSRGFIKVNEYLAVKDLENVFAIGDVSDIQPKQYWCAQEQSRYLAEAIAISLKGDIPVAYEASTRVMMEVLIGEKNGVGYIDDHEMLAAEVVRRRSSLLIENLPKYVDGSLFL